MALSTQASGLARSETALGSTFGLMEAATKGSGKMMSSRVLESSPIRMGIPTKVGGLTVFVTVTVLSTIIMMDHASKVNFVME